MRRAWLVFALAALLLVGCRQFRVPTGADAVLSPDGMHKVEGVPKGILFIRPNYAFGSYPAFSLAPTVVSFKQGSRVLDEAELKELSASFKAVARRTIAATGRGEVAEGGPCVALVTLGLVDLELLNPDQVPAPIAGSLRIVGGVTLVFEIRDGHTREPLLRYGRRQILEARSDDVRGDALVATFERFATRFQKDFEESLSRLPQSESTLSCAARAGAA